MNRKQLNEYRNECLKKSIELRNINPDGIKFKHMEEVRKQQNEFHQKWKFLDGLAKAMDKQEKE